LSPALFQENKTNIVSLILPDSVAALESGSTSLGAFILFTNLRSVTIPNLRSIGDYAFYGCIALENVDFPELVSIGAYSFQTVPLASVNFPTLISIGNNAFQACGSLETVSLPALKSVGDYGFRGCASLEHLTLPGLETIGNYAFYQCTSLPSLTIPRLETIGNYAFYGCTSLTEITLGETPPATVGSGIFQSTGGTAAAKKPITLKVPAAKTGDYETWKADKSGSLNSTTVDLTIDGI
jgi:hypothetical protein